MICYCFPGQFRALLPSSLNEEGTYLSVFYTLFPNQQPAATEYLAILLQH